MLFNHFLFKFAILSRNWVCIEIVLIKVLLRKDYVCLKFKRLLIDSLLALGVRNP